MATFNAMLRRLRGPWDRMQASRRKSGRPWETGGLEDHPLIMLIRYHCYVTQAFIGFFYREDNSAICRAIKRIEDLAKPLFGVQPGNGASSPVVHVDARTTYTMACWPPNSPVRRGQPLTSGPNLISGHQSTKDDENSNSITDEKYLSLETYRRNGTAVRTPIWFAAGPPALSDGRTQRLYAYTTAESGKVRRMQRNNSVRIAPCTMRGSITGPWSSGHAEFVVGEEFDLGMRLLGQKYFPWKRLLDIAASLFSLGKRVVFVIQVVPGDPPR